MDELQRATAELKKAKRRWERAVKKAAAVEGTTLRDVAKRAECSHEQVRIVVRRTT